MPCNRYSTAPVCSHTPVWITEGTTYPIGTLNVVARFQRHILLCDLLWLPQMERYVHAQFAYTETHTHIFFHYPDLWETELKPLLLVLIITDNCILVFPPLYLRCMLPHSSSTGYHAYTQVKQLQTQPVFKESAGHTWFGKRINIQSVHSHIHLHIPF
jgi:hypothetical protein